MTGCEETDQLWYKKKRVLLLNSVDSSAAPAHVLNICCVFASHLEKRRTDFGNVEISGLFCSFLTLQRILPWCEPTLPWTWPMCWQMSNCVLVPLTWACRTEGLIHFCTNKLTRVCKSDSTSCSRFKGLSSSTGLQTNFSGLGLLWDHGTIQSWFTYDVRPAFCYRIPSGVKNEDKGLRTLKRRESLPLNCCQGKHFGCWKSELLNHLMWWKLHEMLRFPVWLLHQRVLTRKYSLKEDLLPLKWKISCILCQRKKNPILQSLMIFKIFPWFSAVLCES